VITPPTADPTSAISSTSTPVVVGNSSSSAASPATGSPASVLGAAPADTLPAIPAGFTPVILIEYRGSHPKAGQLGAGPDAVLELRDFQGFGALFGTAVPPATQLADEIDNALRWTALREATEAFLVYAKSGEAVAWKTALTDLDKLDPVVQVVTITNPTALVGCPALVRTLDVPKAIARRGQASRVRNTKADKTAATGTAASTPHA
jgi:hypothetical protein